MVDVFTRTVGLRYLFIGASGFSKLVNAISIVGLALGIMLMIVVASVFNGLTDERRDRLLRAVPHAFLPTEHFTTAQIQEIESMPRVTSVQREFHGMSFVRGGDGVAITVDLIGIDLEAGAAQKLRFVEGELSTDGAINQVALSRDLASRLGLSVDDRLDLTFVAPTPNGLKTQTATYVIAALFRFMTEVDAGSAFVGIDSIEGTPLEVTGKLGWNVSVTDPFQVAEVFTNDSRIVTWIDKYGEAFRAYQLERSAMYILMTLVLMLASFNIIAGQAMLINVKRSDIAILTTIGASRRQLLGAFALQGGLIILTGIMLGLVLGFLIADNINVIFDTFDELLGVTILEQSTFEELPSRIALWDVIGAVAIAVVLGSIALVRPLRLALIESPVYALNRAT
ncbi:MAG: FtsX-like permease family protein [Gammaproteobacteria bacterium]|nr:FtsX-like permease family protein [Gammaproteobacteria bacterium]